MTEQKKLSWLSMQQNCQECRALMWNSSSYAPKTDTNANMTLIFLRNYNHLYYYTCNYFLLNVFI